MKEYIIWAINPLDGKGERPISEKVYNKSENDKRMKTAIANGWQNVHTQVIDYNTNTNFAELFIKTINTKK